MPRRRMPRLLTIGAAIALLVVGVVIGLILQNVWLGVLLAVIVGIVWLVGAQSRRGGNSGVNDESHGIEL